MSLGAGSEVSEVNPGLACLGFFLLPADRQVEPSAPLQHHVCLDATVLPALMIRE